MLFGIQPMLSPIPASTTLYLLDVYPTNARYAFGLERLISGYSGDIVKVERDFDNATQNFALSGDTLNQTAIVDFVTNSGAQPAANGHVTTWFSQINGETVDENAATLANTPKIVDSGAIVTEGGKTALLFDGGDKLDNTFGFGSGVTDLCLASVYNHTGPDNVERTIFADGLNSGDFVHVRETPLQSAIIEVSRNALGNIVYATGGTSGYTGRVTSVHTTVPQGASSSTGGFANTDTYANGGGFGDAPLKMKLPAGLWCER